MKILNFLKNKKLYIVVTMWVLLCLLVTPVYTTITVNYLEDPAGEAVTTVFTSLRENVSSKGARARTIYEGVARISFYDLQYLNHCSVKRIDPLDENWQNEQLVTIESIQVHKNGVCVWEAAGNELQNYFTGNEQTLDQESQEGLSFYVQGNDSQLLPTETFIQEYVSSGRVLSIVTAICYGVALMLVTYFVVNWFAKGLKETESTFGKVTYWIFLGAIAAAVILCFYIGSRSPFWLNPDEYEVRAAVRFYKTHWFPPDLRSEEIADAFAPRNIQ